MRLRTNLTCQILEVCGIVCKETLDSSPNYILPHPCNLSAQSPRRTKRTQPRAIRKKQSVSKKQGTDNNLPRERRSLYFRFQHHVSKPQGLPYIMLQNFCIEIWREMKKNKTFCAFYPLIFADSFDLHLL